MVEVEANFCHHSQFRIPDSGLRIRDYGFGILAFRVALMNYGIGVCPRLVSIKCTI